MTNEPLCRCVEPERRRIRKTGSAAEQKVGITGLTTIETMSYMQEVEEGVKVFIEKGDAGGLLEFVKEKVLQSYKNGLEAGRGGQGRYGGRREGDFRRKPSPKGRI